MQQNKLRTPWPRWSRYVCFTALFLMTLFVFSNSLQVATESSKISGSLLETLYKMLPLLRQWLTEHILRKMGHFTEYSVIGVLLMLCLRSCTVRVLPHITKAILGGVLIAMTDETIQLFVEGRSGEVLDVWLDSSGVCFGLLVMGCALVLIEHYLAHRRKRIGEDK